MDGEIVDSLFSLFDQCVAIDFPNSSLLSFRFTFSKSLVDRDCSHRNRTVTNDPFAGSWILSPVERSIKVSPPPFAAPYSLFDLFVYTGRKGGVADIGVDLH